MKLNAKRRKINYSNQKGITLIVLVITIVVLLILAGVSINAIFSENGIIKKAQDAQNKMDQATQNDLETINSLNDTISKWSEEKEGEKLLDIVERYILGEDKKGILATTIIDISNAPTSFKFIGNEIIPDAETSMEFKTFEQDGNNIKISFEYKNNYYAATADATTYITKTVELLNNKNINVFSTTVILNPAENMSQPTLEQKKEIAAILCDFSNYEELTKAYGDLNEESIDKLISVARKFINYSNTSEVEKLQNLGVKIISVITPYGSTLYTSNLGEPVKCSFNKNGSYDFIIKKEAEEKKETIKIDNIRTAATTAPYKVNVEKLFSSVEYPSYLSGNLLYSVDGTDDWKEVKDNMVITCNNSIYIKFADEFMGGTVQDALHCVEKNDEYYKYFNDQNPMEWGLVRSVYIIRDTLKCSTSTVRQNIIKYILGIGTNNSKVLTKILTNLNTSRNVNFFTDSSKTSYMEALQKYPELKLGSYVMTWDQESDDGVVETESPIYKLEVNHDMSIILHDEGSD